MIRRTIHHLRQRPHHERRQFAALFSIGVVIILFIAWGFFFVRKIASQPVTIQNDTSGQVGAAANATGPNTNDQQGSVNSPLDYTRGQ